VKQPRIYLDTSVIGGCFDDEFAAWSNGLMRDFASGRYVPLLSDVLAAEVEDAPEAVHIVHFDKIRLFNSVNLELGYKPLLIYSPREVTTIEGSGG
jgi:hypothetical protein